MRTRSAPAFLPAALVVATLVLGSATGAAKPACPPAVWEQAAEQAKKARGFSEAGRYEDALQLLEEAFDSCPDGKLRSAIGRVLERAGRDVEALDAYRECARIASENATRSDCERRARTLAGKLGGDSSSGGSPRGAAKAVPPGKVDWERRAKAVVRVYNVPMWEVGFVDGQLGGKPVKVPVALPSLGHGSGLIIDGGGVIVTNRHVVAESQFLAVKVEGLNEAFPAEVIRRAQGVDLAFLLIDFPGARERAMEVGAGAVHLERNDELTVIGYPKDASADQAALSRGVVSRYVDVPGEGRLLQTTASINAGNSGGPAFAADGRFAGTVVAKYKESEGMGLVIPAALVRTEIDAMRASADLTGARMRMLGRDLQLEGVLAKLTADIVELGGRVQFDRNPLTALNALARPWASRQDELMRYRKSSRGASIDMMLAGVLWNLNVQRLVEGPDSQRFDAFRKLLEVSDLVRDAVAREPGLGNNKFVGMVSEFKRVVQKEAGESGLVRCGEHEAWSRSEGRCTCMSGYYSQGGRCVQVRCGDHESFDRGAGRCQCESGYERTGRGCTPVDCGDHGFWQRYPPQCACESGYFRDGFACSPIPSCGLGGEFSESLGRCTCRDNAVNWSGTCVPGVLPSYLVRHDASRTWMIWARGGAVVGSPYLNDRGLGQLLGPFHGALGFGYDLFAFELGYRAKMTTQPYFFRDEGRNHVIDFDAFFGREERTGSLGLGISPAPDNAKNWKVAHTRFSWEEKWRSYGDSNRMNNLLLTTEISWMPWWDFSFGAFYHHMSPGLEVKAGLLGGFWDFPGMEIQDPEYDHRHLTDLESGRTGYIAIPVQFTVVLPTWLEWGLGIEYRRLYLDKELLNNGGLHLADFSARLGLVLPFLNLGATAHLQLSGDHDLGWYVSTDAMFHY